MPLTLTTLSHSLCGLKVPTLGQGSLLLSIISGCQIWGAHSGKQLPSPMGPDP